MGKDNTKILSNSGVNRLHSPWLLNDNKRNAPDKAGFGPFSKNDDIEIYIDKDISQAISQLDKEQAMTRLLVQEEDEGDDDTLKLLKQAEGLKLYTSENANVITVPESDLLLESVLKVPEDQQTPLLTLKDKVLAKDSYQKEPTPLCASNPKVQKIYKKIGFQLARYHSFKKLPKALKVIPSLPNWDDILLLTNPNKWTPQAIYDMTLIFITNVKIRQIQQFLQYVLLPLTRQNMIANKGTLEQPILFALQKVMEARPRFFLKGFLIPLCDSRSCTTQEAMILATLITKSKMKKMDSTDALYCLADHPTTVPVSILVLALLQKEQIMNQTTFSRLLSKYFERDHEVVFPFVWYQSLLVFLKKHHMNWGVSKKLANIINRAPDNEVTNTLKSIAASCRVHDVEDSYSPVCSDSEPEGETEGEDSISGSDDSMALD